MDNENISIDASIMQNSSAYIVPFQDLNKNWLLYTNDSDCMTVYSGDLKIN